MSNPLSIIRKHQAKLLVIFGIIIMFAFIVGPIIIQFLDSMQRGSSIANDVVVTWAGGKLREKDLDELHIAREHMKWFQREIIRQTLEKKGQPKVEPLPDDDSDESLAMTAILARKAKDSGIVITDDDAENYLYQLGDGEIPRSSFPEIAASLKLDWELIVDQVKVELAARNLIFVAQGSGGGVSPVAAWEYFNRLNRSVTIEAVPLRVEDYLAKVTDEPSESEIKTLYEKHKFDYSSPDSVEPGFRRPLRIALSYARFDFDKFVDRAKANVTDEQVEEYYERNKETFRIPNLEEPKEDTPDGDKPTTDPTDKPDGEEPAGDKPASDPTDKTNGESSDVDNKPDAGAEPPTGDAENSDADAPDKKRDDADANGSKPATESTDKTGGKQPDDDNTAEDAGASNCDDAAVATSDAPETADAGSSPSERGTSEAQPESDADDTTSGDAADPAATAEPHASPKDASTQSEPGEQPPTGANDKPEPGDDSTTPDPAPDPPKPEYRTLQEVADQIRGRLAQAPASAEFIAAIKDVELAVNRYQPRYRRWQVQIQTNPGATQPEPPDPEELARTHGLTAGITPLVDAISIRQYDIGKLADTNQQFLAEAFREGVPEYKAALGFDTPWGQTFFAQGMSGGKVAYVYWRTSIAPSEVPALEDVRDDVVRAWKLQKARSLAREDAQQKAEQASRAASLKELFGDAAITVGLFTWMQPSSVTFGGGGQPRMSDVPGIDQPGDEFMREVFSLGKGETGAAMNAPQSVVYVVRIEDRSPSDRELHDLFFRARPNSLDILTIGEAERYTLVADSYRGLAKELDIQWQREPRSGGQE